MKEKIDKRALARERNFNKFMLTRAAGLLGCVAHTYDTGLYKEEKEQLEALCLQLNTILDLWPANHPMIEMKRMK